MGKEVFDSPLHGGVGPLTRTHPRDRQLVLGPLQMHGVDAGSLVAQQAACRSHQRFELVRRRDGMHDEIGPHVTALHRRIGRIGQSEPFTHGIDQGRRHPLAQQMGRQRGHETRTLRVLALQLLEHQGIGQVHEHLGHLREALRQGLPHILCGLRGQCHSRIGGSRHAGEQLRRLLQPGRHIEVSGRDDDGLFSHVMGLHMAHQILPREAFDIGHRADHRHAHGVVAPDGAVQQIAGAVLRVLFVLDGLLPDHLQLPLQLMLGKHAVQHDVRNHSQQGLRMPAQAGHEIAGDVLAGEGVDLRTQPLRIQVDLLHGTRVRALERHVFQHMADAVAGGGLVAGAHAQEHTHADALQVRHGQRQQPDPIRKSAQGHGRPLQFGCRQGLFLNHGLLSSRSRGCAGQPSSALFHVPVLKAAGSSGPADLRVTPPGAGTTPENRWAPGAAGPPAARSGCRALVPPGTEKPGRDGRHPRPLLRNPVRCG